MKKKGLLTLAIAATLLCGSVGMITAAADDVAADSATKVTVNLDWVDVYGTGAKVETNATTGAPLFTINDWGQRVHSTSKVKLDGLTVTMSSTQHKANTRFGFGFSGEKGKYTLAEETTVNVTWIPYQYDGQNRLYVNKDHSDGTVCYLDQALTSRGFGLDQSFVAAGTADDAYSFTFDKVSETLWSVTVDVVKGQKFDGQTTPCTVYFADSNMVNILDENGECYLSAWGMQNPGAFSLKVETPYVAPEYAPVSIPEANAAEDGTKVQVSGTVSAINTAWSEQYGNITVTIVDAEGNSLYVYRMKTNVAVGDIITIKGVMGSYNGSKQVVAGSTAEITGHDSSYDYAEMTIAEALAAEDNTNVIVTGTVVEIGTAYSEQYGNISVYIADEAGTRLYLYRLTGNVEVGQIIKVKGAMATYKGNRQVTGGTYEAVGTHECANYTEATCQAPATCVVCGTAKDEVVLDHNYVDGACTMCGAEEPAPAFIEVYLQPGDNTITMAAGQYALAYMRGAGKFTFTWTGEATIMAGRMPIANGDVVDYNPMMGAFTIMPTNAEAECTVVLTVAEYVAPVVEVQLGANAIKVPVENNYCAGVVVQFTATEAGEYVIKPAEGETNADITVIGEVTEWIEEYPYTFTMEAGATLQFLVCTSDVMLTEDTIDFVIEVAADEPIDPPTSDEPIDPPTSDEPIDPPTSDEPDEPTSSEEPDEPADSSTDEPTTSEPATSEPEEEKKGGCGSVIGGVSAALTLVAAAAIVMKKKED